MEDEEGYTALTFQARRNASKAASPAKKQALLEHHLEFINLDVTTAVPSQGLHWQLVTLLWVAFIGTVMLVVAVRVLVSQLVYDREKASAGPCPVKCNCSSDNFLSLLRSRICNQSQSNSSVNSSCQICLPHWHLHQDKCYWLSKAFKSWNESQSDCLAKGAQLAVIQVKEEIEFLKKITEDAQTYWIGLSLSENKWRWITGHQLDQNVFREPPSSAGVESCGTIKRSKIILDVCSAVYRWICQKDPILL